MNKILNISDKINPLDRKAIVNVKEIADALKIPFFIVGASARDYVLEYCYGAMITRKTGDIDIGVEVSSWSDYEKFEEELINSKKFEKGNKINRFVFERKTLVDIIPFGQIADKGRFISWPQEHEIVMTILGFTEAHDTALNIIIDENPEVSIKVPTLAGLLIMKLISWHENYGRREKDGRDIYKIMTNYDYDENIERLFSEEMEINENEGWIIDNASIRLIGKDMKRLASKETAILLNEILIYALDDNEGYPIVKDMRKEKSSEDDSELIRMLETLRKGLGEEI